MNATIMQMLSKDYKDSYLTKNPQVTHFRTPQKQHTPFAMDTIREEFNTIPNFTDEVVCQLSKYGDLIDSITIEFTLPSVQISKVPDMPIPLELLDNSTITYDDYTLTLDQMIIQYKTLYERFNLFLKPAMIYWRKIRELLQNSNTN